jgi:hypothetical protein
VQQNLNFTTKYVGKELAYTQSPVVARVARLRLQDFGCGKSSRTCCLSMEYNNPITVGVTQLAQGEELDERDKPASHRG